jgi:hypothetical protein
MLMSNGIDYAAEAELFDYATEAELFSRSGWRKTSHRPPLGYKRFARLGRHPFRNRGARPATSYEHNSRSSREKIPIQGNTPIV